jgi:hypothetical protein
MERQMIIDQSCKRATEQTKTTVPQSKDKMTEPETRKEKMKKASLRYLCIIMSHRIHPAG